MAVAISVGGAQESATATSTTRPVDESLNAWLDRMRDQAFGSPPAVAAAEVEVRNRLTKDPTAVDAILDNLAAKDYLTIERATFVLPLAGVCARRAIPRLISIAAQGGWPGKAALDVLAGVITRLQQTLDDTPWEPAQIDPAWDGLTPATLRKVIAESYAAAAPLLHRSLESDDGLARYRAVSVLSAFGDVAAPSAASLAALIDRNASDVDALLALTRIDKDGEFAVSMLGRAIEKRAVKLDRRLLAAVVKFGARMTSCSSQLLQLLRQRPEVDVTEEVIDALYAVHADPREVVPAIEALARDGDSQGSVGVVSAIRDFDPEGTIAIPALTRLVKDCDKHTLVEAAKTLAFFGERAAPASRIVFDRFQALPMTYWWDGAASRAADSRPVQDVTSSVRRVIVLWAFKSIGVAGGWAIPRILEMIGTEADDWVRQTLIRSLPSLDPSGSRFLSHIVARLDRSWSSGDNAAILAVLEELGPASALAMPSLQRLLSRGPDERVVRVLGRIGLAARSAVPALLGLVGRNDAYDDKRIGEALVGIGADPSDVFPALLPHLASPDPTRVENIIQILDQFPAPPLSNVSDAINALSPGRTPSDGLRAAYLLGRHAADADRVVPALAGALSSPSLNMRRLAAHALGEFGPRAQSAVPRLIALLDTDYASLGTSELTRSDRIERDKNAEFWREGIVTEAVETLGKTGVGAARATEAIIRTVRRADGLEPHQLDKTTVEALDRINGTRRRRLPVIVEPDLRVPTNRVRHSPAGRPRDSGVRLNLNSEPDGSRRIVIYPEANPGEMRFAGDWLNLYIKLDSPGTASFSVEGWSWTDCGPQFSYKVPDRVASIRIRSVRFGTGESFDAIVNWRNGDSIEFSIPDPFRK